MYKVHLSSGVGKCQADKDEQTTEQEQPPGLPQSQDSYISLNCPAN